MKNGLESTFIEFRQVYPFVYTQRDEGWFQYERHYHKWDISLYILEGSLIFHFENGTKRRLKLGDRYDIPSWFFHTVDVWNDGCSYIVGQEFEDDEEYE